MDCLVGGGDGDSVDGDLLERLGGGDGECGEGDLFDRLGAGGGDGNRLRSSFCDR